ncbi:hypothetical protein [Hyphomicrobium sp. DMF-1]|uniref:hypothetical protein n=1 Tax=Hyphomicrobium sp. DMF-1 TaxID=3019544 RepID=UPI0022EC07C1|nr:hypothetical protein [Hyphomicrobium sp. DMF-1]WBT40129.1 hypothetical protein PE058_09675 [Hyphomicrobium sp. DMF-1]
MQGDLSALIERVEKCSKPDFLLEREIAKAIGGWRESKFWFTNINGSTEATTLWHPEKHSVEEWAKVTEFDPYLPQASEAPAYTSSLDAALALVEEQLPGWTRLVDATAPELGICVELFPSGDIAERTESARGDHNRETHATLLALLRALSNGSKEGVA